MLKTLVGTFTILDTYRKCPEQMAHRYVLKDLGLFVETPEMAWGNMVHSAFEHRVGAKKPLPAEVNKPLPIGPDGIARFEKFNMQQWEPFAAPFDVLPVKVEQKLGVTAEGKPCDFWDKAVWFRGKADVTTIQKQACYIPDWKTGSSKFEDPFELATQALLVQAHNPHVRVLKGNYVWLKENRVGQPYDLSDTRETWREICRLMGEIEADIKSGNWEKQQSGLCGWCPVQKCEHWRPRR